MKNIFIFFCLILAIGLNAQKITPTVIANAGNVVKNATHSIEWTLGEFMTETLKNNNGSITQGFHQANLLFVAVDDAEIAGLEVFPNPVNATLTIKNGSEESLNLNISHISGSEIFKDKITIGTESLKFDSAKGSKTFKIEKQ
jgi:hypothetical protein